jgi:hypothetical protein
MWGCRDLASGPGSWPHRHRAEAHEVKQLHSDSKYCHNTIAHNRRLLLEDGAKASQRYATCGNPERSGQLETRCLRTCSPSITHPRLPDLRTSKHRELVTYKALGSRRSTRPCVRTPFRFGLHVYHVYHRSINRPLGEPGRSRCGPAARKRPGDFALRCQREVQEGRVESRASGGPSGCREGNGRLRHVGVRCEIWQT